MTMRQERFDSQNPVTCKKTRWILCRLQRRGYKLWRSGEYTHAQLPPTMAYPVWDPCNLIITVKDGDVLQTKVTFRPRYEQDIHVTRYLQLNRLTGWALLDEFEQFYRRRCHWITCEEK